MWQCWDTISAQPKLEPQTHSFSEEVSWTALTGSPSTRTPTLYKMVWPLDPEQNARGFQDSTKIISIILKWGHWKGI